MTRRGFVKRAGAVGLWAGSGGLAGCAAKPARPLAEPGRASTPAGAAVAKPLSEVDRFDYVVGTQTFSPSYGFTSKPRLLETAEAIRDMGASVIKFRLGHGKRRQSQPPAFKTLRQVAVKDPVTRQILALPFAYYLLWAYPMGGNQHASEAPADRDQELYELSCYLLEAYRGTGKTFYLGHWEGDWELRRYAGDPNDPTPQAVARKIEWLDRRQRAVDDAKRDTPHTGVDVFCYAEVNKVQDAIAGRRTMTNDVIPHTDIDFVSYSSYDTTNQHVAELPAALDYIESKLPAKAGFKGRRVWIGEYGYPAIRFSPQEQDARSRQVIRAGLEWGCPFVLYWEMYNNEIDKEGKQRGFWLIDDKGVKQPVYYTHQRLCQWGRQHVGEHLQKNQAPPSLAEYRQAALAFLGDE